MCSVPTAAWSLPPDTNETRPRLLLSGGSALIVELVEDRGQQGCDHLEGVERAAV